MKKSTKFFLFIVFIIAIIWLDWRLKNPPDPEKVFKGYETKIVFLSDEEINNEYIGINSYTKLGWEIKSSRRAHTGNYIKTWGTEFTLQKPIYEIKE